ncbi:MAG TPA: hypothetical protein VMP00_13060, partial [Burkholderiales bacterium]|nr:hypothetical protein [Burkholderiales bacterium]
LLQLHRHGRVRTGVRRPGIIKRPHRKGAKSAKAGKPEQKTTKRTKDTKKDEMNFPDVRIRDCCYTARITVREM